MMNCKEFLNELPELILTPGARPSAAAAAHLLQCPPCTEELESYSSTFAVLDQWKAPEPSPYFDQKMAVRLREEQAAPRISWFESVMTRMQLNTGRQFRPVMIGALALALIAGGGGLAELTGVGAQKAKPVATSATVQDLQILDKNEQAFEQLDLLQDEDGQPPQPGENAPADSPTT